MQTEQSALPKLRNPDDIDQEYWCRDFLNEANNALRAHLEVYASATADIAGGNPGRWDVESSWGALQCIVNDLSEHTLNLLRPVPVIKRPRRVQLCALVLSDYLGVSREIPLVKGGYTTNHDAAQYARLLTKMLETVTLLLAPGAPPPDQVFSVWRKQKFR